MMEHFIKGIQYIMENENVRVKIAKQRIEYVKIRYTIKKFVENFRLEIIQAVN